MSAASPSDVGASDPQLPFRDRTTFESIEPIQLGFRLMRSRYFFVLTIFSEASVGDESSCVSCVCYSGRQPIISSLVHKPRNRRGSNCAKLCFRTSRWFAPSPFGDSSRSKLLLLCLPSLGASADWLTSSRLLQNQQNQSLCPFFCSILTFAEKPHLATSTSDAQTFAASRFRCISRVRYIIRFLIEPRIFFKTIFSF
jgi:hypothetical protein